MNELISQHPFSDATPKAQGTKVKIIVAEHGKFLETVKRHAHEAIAVFPYGADWEPIIQSVDAFEALLTLPIRRLPTHSHELT